MNEHVKQIEAVANITDVKHYAVDIDENGNEVRREIKPIDYSKEASPAQSK